MNILLAWNKSQDIRNNMDNKVFSSSKITLLYQILSLFLKPIPEPKYPL
jgi:hypothetical protein